MNPGRRIMEESLAIIERELGPLDLPAWAVAVVKRMIHASADFDFAGTLRYHQEFEKAALEALRAGCPLVTDVEMVRIGIQAGSSVGNVHCYLNDPAVDHLDDVDPLTRSAAGIRLASQRHERPFVVIGTAPTALDEALRLVETGAWNPAALVAVPVGFVGVEEAKVRLVQQDRVPYLTCLGRKGGSAVTAAAVNALIEWSAV